MRICNGRVLNGTKVRACFVPICKDVLLLMHPTQDRDEDRMDLIDRYLDVSFLLISCKLGLLNLTLSANPVRTNITIQARNRPSHPQGACVQVLL